MAGRSLLWLDLAVLLGTAAVGAAFGVLWHPAILLISLSLLVQGWLLWRYQRSSEFTRWASPAVLVWGTAPRIVFFTAWDVGTGELLFIAFAILPALTLATRLRNFSLSVVGAMAGAALVGLLGIAGIYALG